MQQTNDTNTRKKSKFQWTNAIVVLISLTGYVLSKHFDYVWLYTFFAIIGIVTIVSLLIPKNISKIATIILVIAGFLLNVAVFSEKLFFDTGSRELGQVCIATAIVAFFYYWNNTRKLEKKQAKKA